MKPFKQIMQAAQLRMFTLELEEMGIHKSLEDFEINEQEAVFTFKETTPKDLLQDLQFIFKDNVTLSESKILFSLKSF